MFPSECYYYNLILDLPNFRVILVAKDETVDHKSTKVAVNIFAQ